MKKTEEQIRAALLSARKKRRELPKDSPDRRVLASVIVILEDAVTRIRKGE